MLVDVVEAELGSSKARPLGRSRPNAGQLALAFNMRSLAEIQSGRLIFVQRRCDLGKSAVTRH